MKHPATEEMETSLAPVQAKAELTPLDSSVFEEYAGLGNENVTSDDIQTQFLGIIESNSPYLKKTDGKYIKGAEAGMIVNNVTREVFAGDKGIAFIPCFFSVEVVEWNPQRKIVARHAVDSKEYVESEKSNRRNAQNKLINAAGNEMVKTHYHAGLFVDLVTGTPTRTTIAMTSTKLKKSKTLNTLIDAQRLPGSGKPAPRFTQVFQLVVVPEKNDKGDFFNWEPKFRGFVPSKQVLDEAVGYYKMVKETGVAAPPSTEEDALNGKETDEVPF